MTGYLEQAAMHLQAAAGIAERLPAASAREAPGLRSEYARRLELAREYKQLAEIEAMCIAFPADPGETGGPS